MRYNDRRSGKGKPPRIHLPQDLHLLLLEKLKGLSQSVKTEYLISECLSKFVSSETEPADVRRNAALRIWLAAERDNEATTDRLLTTPGEYQILPRVTYDRFVRWVQAEIARIIGDTPSVDALIGSFSGGASTSRARTESHPAGKYVGKAHVTPRAWELFEDLVIPEVPTWYWSEWPDLIIEERPGNVLFTVPKKTDRDRVACKEPDLNMFMQKGLGDAIRVALKRTGINLNDQSINRSLALRASQDGSMATLDLSSASDSVTTELVRLLLPVSWFTLLDSVRSPVTIIDGEEHSNWMFSSMGNGFTFELESLIFLALTRAVSYFRGVRGTVSVYGDDIICPTETAHYVSWVLSYFGFQVNTEKSFFDGPFRESCGGHYWNGVDITPFYIREPITDLEGLILLANNLRRWCAEYVGGELFSPILDPEAEPIWLWLKSLIPEYLWGGGDLSFKGQLVSRDTPSKRLIPEEKRTDAGPGGYHHWLNATWARTKPGDGITTSRRTINQAKPRVRLRPVRDTTVPVLPAIFYSEIR